LTREKGDAETLFVAATIAISNPRRRAVPSSHNALLILLFAKFLSVARLKIFAGAITAILFRPVSFFAIFKKKSPP